MSEDELLELLFPATSSIIPGSVRFVRFLPKNGVVAWEISAEVVREVGSVEVRRILSELLSSRLSKVRDSG